MKNQVSKTTFPDNERKLMEERIASKDWKCCAQCDWFYNRAVLERCPLCHYAWANGDKYKQPKYESPSLT